MKLLIPGFLLLLLIGCDQDKSGNHSAAPPAGTVSAERTNTAVNARDSGGGTKTPMDQKENQSDLNITADIRKQVENAKLSTNAENVKIVTENGKVTLRGPVNTEEEKQKIEEIAKNVAGASQVNDQLEVTTK